MTNPATMRRSAAPSKPDAIRYSAKRKAAKVGGTGGGKPSMSGLDFPAILREEMADAASSDNANSAIEYLSTRLGKVFYGNSLDLLRQRVDDASVDLIMTSPPFGYVRKKDYGNVDAEEYVEWFKQFGRQFHRVLKDTGSFVIDIGGA